jgi:hypothetical protein
MWVSGQITETERISKYPNHVPPFENFFVLEVSPDGRILQQISIFDVLIQNGLQGLMNMQTPANEVTKVDGDTLHLNDVETFPSTLAPGVFTRGDIMISLRNINAIFVFDPVSGRIKFKDIGRVIRQHDPDFIDGNQISIFDNNNLAPDNADRFSRIAISSATDGMIDTAYSGSEANPFFTSIIGNHQWLANGNLLVTSSRQGYAFEVDKAGKIVWQFFNLVGENTLGLLNDTQRLAPSFDTGFFKSIAHECKSE